MWRVLVMLSLIGGSLAAQDASRQTEPVPDPTIAATTAFDGRLESVALVNGTEYRGLILTHEAGEVEFAEIHRPPGKPMYAVVRGISTDSIQSISRLPDPLHDRLQSHFMRFKNRARIEAGRIDAVTLVRGDWPTTGEAWRYHGNWFDLTSTADERSTRRCIVQIEQVFRAYRQLIPPRTRREDRLLVMLLGSADQYQGFLQREGVEIDSPAFYSVARNMIVAGSDLTYYQQRLDQARAENEQVLQQYRTLDDDFKQRLVRLVEQLRQSGYSRQQIDQERSLRQASWEREYMQVRNRIKEINRVNESRMADVTRRMMKRLYHEAFHAYLDNFVYPRAANSVPHWLNEGLAQIFENGQLELGMLRIDAPDQQAVTELERDLRGESPLTLEQLLTADPAQFLVTHAAGSSLRHYRYSWGLTYYLTFHRDLLSDGALQRYVQSTAEDPVQRFEDFTGQPLAEFQRQWRDAMLRLR